MTLGRFGQAGGTENALGLVQVLQWLHPDWDESCVTGFLSQVTQAGDHAVWFTRKLGARLVEAGYVRERHGGLPAVVPIIYHAAEQATDSLSQSLGQFMETLPLANAVALSVLIPRRHCEITKGSLSFQGFTVHSELEQMICLLGRETLLADQESGEEKLAWRRANSADVETVQSVMDLTQVDTLDCLGTDAFRSRYGTTLSTEISSAMSADFQAQYLLSESRATAWVLCDGSDKEVGCAVVGPDGSVAAGTDAWESSQVDLLYFGLLPEIRGRGFGKALLSQLLCAVAGEIFTEQQGEEPVCFRTWVDADNTPARATYAASGFYVLDRSELWIRPI